MSIEKEDFEVWKEHPITKAVMEKATKLAEAYKEAWLKQSWGADIEKMSKLTTEQLAYLRGKADVANSFAKLEFRNLFKEQ